MKRVRLELTPGLQIEFTDRERALRQAEELAREGTWWPIVIFGPEGCGKTAFLRQASLMLKELGYDVFYLHPLDRVFAADVDDVDVKSTFLNLVRQTLEDEKWARVIFAVFDLVRELLRRRKRKVAIIADDVFQVIGLDKAAGYVKGLLNMIEHPQYEYENIVVLVATSEGVTRGEIGRHRWAHLTPMWNMSKEGFQELYEKIPGPKPPFDEVWRWTGGNPNMFRELHKARWDVDEVVNVIIVQRKLSAFVSKLTEEERRWLLEAVEDPDTFYSRERISLMERLVEMNLLVDEMYPRGRSHWIDEPPPEKDLELGIGEKAAWHTPIHREAVKRALEVT